VVAIAKHGRNGGRNHTYIIRQLKYGVGKLGNKTSDDRCWRDGRYKCPYVEMLGVINRCAKLHGCCNYMAKRLDIKKYKTPFLEISRL